MISAAKNCCCCDTSNVHRRTVMVNQLVLVPQSFLCCRQTRSLTPCKTSKPIWPGETFPDEQCPRNQKQPHQNASDVRMTYLAFFRRRNKRPFH